MWKQSFYQNQKFLHYFSKLLSKAFQPFQAYSKPSMQAKAHNYIPLRSLIIIINYFCKPSGYTYFCSWKYLNF